MAKSKIVKNSQLYPGPQRVNQLALSHFTLQEMRVWYQTTPTLPQSTPKAANFGAKGHWPGCPTVLDVLRVRNSWFLNFNKYKEEEEIEGSAFYECYNTGIDTLILPHCGLTSRNVEKQWKVKVQEINIEVQVSDTICSHLQLFKTISLIFKYRSSIPNV